MILSKDKENRSKDIVQIGLMKNDHLNKMPFEERFFYLAYFMVKFNINKIELRKI